MNNNIAKCGCDCSKCPTCKWNIRTLEDRVKCSAGWSEYLNIKLSPEKLRACDGCSIPDSERNVYYLNCRVRKCAMINGIENCAFCSAFPCHDLSEVHSLQKISSNEDFTRKTGTGISETEYKKFIEPYAGLYHLSKIRKKLSEDAIRDYKRFTTKSNFAPFTQIKGQDERLTVIYNLMTKIAAEQNISFARQQILQKRREQGFQIFCFG